MRSPATERPFRLPVGYRDSRGTCHRDGVLRAATARDEMRTLGDFRVYLRPASFLILMLARTMVRLGDLSGACVRLVESLCDRDLAVLERHYRELNGYDGIHRHTDASIGDGHENDSHPAG